MQKLSEAKLLSRLEKYPDLLQEYRSGKLTHHQTLRRCNCRDHHHNNAIELRAKKQEHYRKSRKAEQPRYLLNNAKRRSGLENVPIDITLDFVNEYLNQTCPVFGTSFMIGTEKPVPESATIDKFIPIEGYTQNNSWVISHKANTIKSNGSPDDVLRVAIWMKLCSRFGHTKSVVEYRKMIISQ